MHVSASLVALSRLRFVFFAAFLCLACANVSAQTAGSDYTTDLPSVDHVKAEIKGSDPTDTLERQVAVFTYLQTYIDRIKYNRSVRGPYTPGETRARAAYSLAAYQMSQDYAKSHTPDEAKAFERRHGQYEMDEVFNDDWQKRLIGPQTAATYNGAVNSLAAGQKAHYNQVLEQNKKDTAVQQAAAGGVSNDPTSATTRRCLELGGDSTACLGKGLTSGIIGLFTGGTGLGDMMDSGRFGIVLSGNYHAPGATTGINFTSDSAGIDRCGDLEVVDTPYTIRKSPASAQIVLESKPRPIALSMRTDGSLVGPGLVDVTGQVIVGYHTVTTTQMINGARAAANQCNGPCQTISRVPDYAPKTVRCSIASFAPPPPAPPASASTSEDGGGIFGALTGMMGTIAPVSEPGLRMTGKYSSSSGLLLDFGGDAVTLDCGQAHVKALYTVENTPAQFAVHVQNGGGPFTLAVASDNTLRGSGSTAVNGRLVSGMNGDNVTFTPHSETCNVGTFAANTAAPSTSIAAGSPAPAPTASPISPAAAAPAGRVTLAAAPSATSPIVPTASTGMILAITTSFPIAKNPLAGRVVQLMSERFDIALRKVGAPIPANTTPGQALQAYSNSCPPPTGCPAAAKLLHPYYVGHATFDGDGKATLTAPVQPGSYYVFCSANGTSGALVWDLPITLRAGDNAITLTATNAELVH